ncbi:hypothetical protein SKTS_10170 [Sulfurimicrobium lacus]|uniref:Uncharacterized protein n=1 Tax=Sulfurimicrobium lacus TaxID=2715678 RepID=A0A6F8VAG2_9PROT|nr:hypothetical protein [Sulfurimicrobium lacus]BCB26131.1 hypothetical protein SKTS_10170 [Sulfurimicrobium lacus]
MNDKIRHILSQITVLEDELRTSLQEQEGRLRYQIEGKRVEFEHVVKDAHVKLKRGLFAWFLTVRPQNYLTAPIIYGMAVPLASIDLFVSFYQLTCFPVYGIARARRADYIVFDHQHLAYLNVIEKFHCLYCSYATGVLAYAREVTARTEQYFCPIKHARKILSAHRRYAYFLDYGEADDFHVRLEEFRKLLAQELECSAAPENDSN